MAQLHDDLGWPRGKVPLNRYRTNVDIEGLALGPFGEDTIRQLRIGVVSAYVVKALERCPMPNIDQTTGSDLERLSTKLLRPTRMGWAVGDDPEAKNAMPFFAQSLNHVYVSGEQQTIKVGDPVIVTEAGEPNVILKLAA